MGLRLRPDVLTSLFENEIASDSGLIGARVQLYFPSLEWRASVSVEPTLINFRPILGAVFGSVALLRLTKINQHFVVFINHAPRVCLFTIQKNVTLV